MLRGLCSSLGRGNPQWVKAGSPRNLGSAPYLLSDPVQVILCLQASALSHLQEQVGSGKPWVATAPGLYSSTFSAFIPPVNLFMKTGPLLVSGVWLLLLALQTVSRPLHLLGPPPERAFLGLQLWEFSGLL